MKKPEREREHQDRSNFELSYPDARFLSAEASEILPAQPLPVIS